jgi:hypothetical protein
VVCNDCASHILAVFAENVTPKTKIARKILSIPVTKRQKHSNYTNLILTGGKLKI